MDETTTTVVNYYTTHYSNQSIVDIVVNSLKDMTSGLTSSLSQAFEKLVLTEDHQSLSMLAIWVLTFLGVGFIWKVVPMIYRFFKNHG